MEEPRLHTNYPADNQKRMPGNKEILLMVRRHGSEFAKMIF